MDEIAPAAERRQSHFWIYTPVILLVLVALGWSVAWWVIRDRAVESFDGWLATEARAGRQWACANRQVGGYPFRVRVTCDSLALRQGALTASLGRVTSASQIYQPAFVITEIEGPLRVSDGRMALEATWDLLQSSIHASSRGFQRFSMVADAPRMTVTAPGQDPLVTHSRHLEFHVRPNSARTADKAYDAALTIKEAQFPPLDHLVGGGEPADFTLDATITQADSFRGKRIDLELERWRKANGAMEVAMLSVAKGTRRVEAKGTLSLDDWHRPQGQFTAASAGLDGLIGNMVGGRLGGSLLSALFGQAQAGTSPAAPPTLVQLPPLRIDNGKVMMGPFAIPGFRFAPLY